MTEAQLIHKAKKGNREALSELVSGYSERVYNLALRILRNKEDAEDILQETFLTVLQKLNTFDGRASFFTWIYRIATNASLMKLRKKKIIFAEFPDNPDLEKNIEQKALVDWSQDPSLQMHKAEVNTVLDNAIDELSDTYRPVFVLRDIEQLSIKETAKILDITEENVKIRLRRARMFLRERLSNYFSERNIS